ncbi:probable iron/ascorbate oxidoreductase DDB_G0283291 [Actinia tenebrosa]|uniref:Probable iron/ascorbate oxidoreductase DDB_G0283291 n=1 Tax=Actinia tenebrosa TaxID=6105 RepID=A0A6P8IKR2_ACTTE|nr:probable iron/ascorbate oxidoreductase DDB_G0283291 [Actinia tenebrosa]
MEKVPIIDISPLIEGDQIKADSLANEFKSALESFGAFYIKGHGIPVDAMNTVLQQARDFFSLPLEKKNALSFKDSNAFRGYFHMGAELTAGKPDIKEGFFFGSNEGRESDYAMFGENRFPDEKDLPDFKVCIESFMSSLSDLGMKFAQLFAGGLGLKDDFIQTMFNPPFYNMTLWHYPPHPKVQDGWGIGPHTDYEVFTFLLQDSVGGLEMKRRDGRWVDLPPIEGTLLVMIGDVTECWTKGLYRAPVHRVKNTHSVSRYSAAFFFQPNLKTVVEPLDMQATKNYEYHPTRKDLKIPFSYGNQLKLNYDKYFGGAATKVLY